VMLVKISKKPYQFRVRLKNIFWKMNPLFR
jgi:hypothetical protein